LPAETIINLAGKDNAVSNTLCTLPVKVLGDSMDPILKNGEKANFNKCFEVGEISKNTILMFKEGTNNRLAVVKQMEGEKLKLFQPNRGDQVIAEILIEDVVAIYAEKYSGGF